MRYVLYNVPFGHFPLQWELPQCLEAAIRQDELRSILIILPTKRQVRRWLRLTVQRYFEVHGRALEVLPFLTLDQLAARILSRLIRRPRLRLLSDAYLMVLLQQAIERAKPRYYTPSAVSSSPALLERLFRIIQGLKEDGVLPIHLRQQLEDPEGCGIVSEHRFRDLIRIYEEYETLLGDTLLDPPGQLQRAVEFLRGERDPETLQRVLIPETLPETMERRYRQVFPGVEAILFDGFSDFKKPEQELLELLCGAPMHVRILLDFSPHNGPLFGKFQSVIQELRNRGYEEFSAEPEGAEPNMLTANAHRVEPEFVQRWPLPLYLRRWLFNTEQPIEHRGFSRMFRIYRVEDRVEEVHLLAKLIQTAATEEGVPYDQMCVVSRLPEIYADLFREIFPQYRIPINVTSQYFLRHSPVVTAIFAVLDLIVTGFRREDLHRALNAPYLHFAALERSAQLDPNVLYTVAVRHRIRGGHRQGGLAGWMERMRQREQQLQRYIAQLQSKPYRDPDLIRQLQSDLAQLRQAQKVMEMLGKTTLVAMPEKQLTASEFVAFLQKEVLERFSITESILHFYHHIRSLPVDAPVAKMALLEEAEKDARALTRFLEILEELLFIESELFDLPKRPFELFVQQLRTAVEHARYQVREKHGYGVTITGMEEIRGIPFRRVFLCGAVEKELPIAYVPEAFLGQMLPEAEEHHLQQERMLFYQTLVNNPEALQQGRFRLTITYPGFQESQEFVRSSFVDALLKITTLAQDGAVYDIPALRVQLLYPEKRQAAQQRLQTLRFLKVCYTPTEVWEAVGQAQAAGDRTAVEKLQRMLPPKMQDRTAAIAKFVRDYPDFQRRRRYAVLHRESTLLQHLLRSPFSVSMLEQFQRCPYQFFAERLLQLRPVEKPEVALSPLERGTLFHTILYRFFSELQGKEAQQVPIMLDPEAAAEYRALLHRIAEEELNRLAFDHPFFALDRQLLLGNDQQQGVLDRWLTAELALAKTGEYRFQPALFEFAFGEEASAPPVAIASDLRLRGKIDRIDVAKDPEKVQFVILDYKSSDTALPSSTQLRRGTALQVPLYLYAARVLLEKLWNIPAVPVSAAYVVLLPSLQKADQPLHRFLFPAAGVPERGKKKQELTVDAVVRAALGTVRRLVAQIRAGHFPVEPERESVCRYCPYASVCRIGDGHSVVEIELEEMGE